MCRRAAAALVATLLLSLAVAQPAPAQPAGTSPPGGTGVVVYEPPVEAPVLDGFRPPASPWSAGNRGLEYGTEPGTPVRAAADGEVVFAGPVAGELHVTVLHADGVRTSYSFLAEVRVAAGRRVARGQVIAVAGSRLHVGARVGNTYIDPAELFAGALHPHVRLVPHDDPVRARLASGLAEAEEREMLRLVVEGGGGLFGSAGSLVRGVASAGGAALRGAGGVLLTATEAALTLDVLERLDLLLHYLVEDPIYIRPMRIAVEAIEIVVLPPPPCTEAGVRVTAPATGRRAVLVGGLGSSSTSAAVEDVHTAELGYRPEDVVRFSYEGGIVPRPPEAGDPSWDDAIPVNPYEPADTTRDIRVAARRLADLLQAMHAADPGTPIDVIAHSMGGLVTQMALAELERRGVPLPSVVVTLGTPHQGSDLATAGAAARTGILAPVAFGMAGLVLDLDSFDPENTAVSQMAESSDLVRVLPPFPEGVEVRTVGARWDWVVPHVRSRAPGATAVVVDGGAGASAHDALPGSAGANREIALALAGLPPACRSRWARLGDLVVGESASLAQDLGGLAMALGPVG